MRYSKTLFGDDISGNDKESCVFNAPTPNSGAPRDALRKSFDSQISQSSVIREIAMLSHNENL